MNVKLSDIGIYFHKSNCASAGVQTKEVDIRDVPTLRNNQKQHYRPCPVCFRNKEKEAKGEKQE